MPPPDENGSVKVAPASNGSAAEPGEVVIYVRNKSPREAWIAEMFGTEFSNGGGFPGDGYVGASCFATSARAHIVVLDRPPTEPGAVVLQTLYTRDGEPARAILSVDLDAAGAISIGSGIPAWWEGDSPTC
jgi:hypothetical protein